MIWSAISHNETIDLISTEITMDSEFNVEVLQNVLTPNVKYIAIKTWIISHNNAAVYTLHVTKNVLEANDVCVLVLSNWKSDNGQICCWIANSIVWQSAKSTSYTRHRSSRLRYAI